LLLQFSWHEGFGLPPLEAMACGTAAVVSDRGALPEIAGPGARVVDPADEAAAAEAIAGLLGDEIARRELAARGRAHAAQFTWERHARGLLQIYREVLDERAG
jgi:glycosyltransferase involved in cell wall biosynthesis